ncbi:MAG: long-chain fatty acid--CoA ligase [Nitrospirota bacterium]
MNQPWLLQYDAGVPEKVDIPAMPLFQMLTQAAETYPSHIATEFYGKEITYQELEEKVNRFANALLNLYIKRGDRVAIMLPNVPQCVIAYYAVLKIGAIAVMTNPLYVERELEVQLADCGAEVIVTLDLFYPRIEAVFKKTALKHIISTSVPDALPFVLSLLYPIKARKEGTYIKLPKESFLHNMKSLMDNATSDAPAVCIFPEDLALLQYTGGTSGTPKGVMLSHRNLIANTFQCRAWMPDLKKGEEVFLGVVPFFHVFGMSACMNLAISLGARIVLLPRFATRDVLEAIQKTKTTIFMGVQAMYVAVNNFPSVKDYDLSSIRICFSGAGALHVEVQRQFESLTGGKLVEGYGLSEASPVTHVNLIYGKRKEACIGLPLPSTNARIVDIETGEKQVAIGEVGELIVSGPQVMQGYWKKENETDNVIKNGWLHTGDMARQDEEGFFFIVDRKKDMIKTRGENVYPREVEEVLYRHPKVMDVVVVGLPLADSFAGEKIKAYIVLKEGQTATASEIMAFCKNDLARFKIPQEIEFRATLPKTMIGKVLRRVLIDEENQKAKNGCL